MFISVYIVDGHYCMYMCGCMHVYTSGLILLHYEVSNYIYIVLYIIVTEKLGRRKLH